MRYRFRFKQLPNQRVVDFAEAVVCTSHGGYGPGEGWRMLVVRSWSRKPFADVEKED